jgi:glucokinase
MPTGTPENKQAIAQTAQKAPLHRDGPRLLADIGGTNARFALECGPDRIGKIHTYPCAKYPGIADAVGAFFNDVAADLKQYGPARHAAIAIANPIDGDEVTMTNHDWAFSIEATRKSLQLETLKVVNDFAALAQAVPALRADQVRQVGTGTVHPTSVGAVGEVRGVLGAGTGLGVAGLVFVDGRWTPIASEGGHASFAPLDEREDDILAFARAKWGHVSFERVASGPGIELIYAALATRAGKAAASIEALDSAAIVERAKQGDALANETVDVFCGVLGSFAGNVAITFGAQGGIYLGGGVVPKLGERFYTSPFRERFEQKGRFVRYLSIIPTYVITAENPAFIGASEILTATLAQ